MEKLIKEMTDVAKKSRDKLKVLYDHECRDGTDFHLAYAQATERWVKALVELREKMEGK